MQVACLDPAEAVMTSADHDVWRHIGEVVDGVLSDIARRTIVHQLDRASAAEGDEAAKAFATADNIRRAMNRGWADLLDLDDESDDGVAA